jgi:virginiamycin B lyase
MFRKAFMIFAAAAMTATAADVQVEFKDWMTPSNPAYPHDPEYAPDGSVWYTAQRAHTIGRLDPKTGTFKEYETPTKGSGPHGLVADKEGNIWYTGNAAANIGKVDVKTGKVTEYPMPDPAARDPHTPIFDGSGMLWFTVQQGNFVGKLNPKTGEVKLVKSLTPNSRPYGIKIHPTGVAVYDLFGTNKIGTINLETMALKEYTLPAAGARPRRIDVAKDGLVYYTDYARGFLGRIDLKDGKVEEWVSPGGARSQPYGIAIRPDGSVWYVETGEEQNMLIRFDPATKAMQKWPIPGGGGVVRHMVSAPNGDLWLADSGVGKITRVVVK